MLTAGKSPAPSKQNHAEILKLEWNFPPGYEGEADGDSCGRKGIFPKALWQRLRLGKEDRIFFLLSTKQEFSEHAARFAL